MVNVLRLTLVVCAALALASSSAHAGDGGDFPDACGKCGAYPDACGPSCRKPACFKHRCHRDRDERRDRSLTDQASDYLRSLTPPAGILVSSVPVFSSPVLLSQERFLAAPAAFPQAQASRDLRPPATRSAPGCESSRDLAPNCRNCPSSSSSRSLASPGNLGELEKQIELLTTTVERNHASLEILKTKIEAIENKFSPRLETLKPLPPTEDGA